MSVARKPSPPNTLYYGDNLDILRRYLEDESIDLIYLDPPFNSNADYNVLFAEKDGTQATPRSRPSKTPGPGTSKPPRNTPKSSAPPTLASPPASKESTTSSAAPT